MTVEKYGFCSATIYFTSVCNLDCVYCYQPKFHEHGVEVNKQIQAWIQSGELEKDLEHYFGENLEYISLWGGEPSINLPLLSPKVKGIVEKFSKLKEFSFSTNLSTPELTRNIIEFLDSIEKANLTFNKEVNLNLQISIDGPPELNDKNRIGASAEIILSNLKTLLRFINSGHSKFVKLSFKGTQASDGIEWLSKRENLHRYYSFWKENYQSWIKEGFKIYPRGGEWISLVFPGNWTVEDGKNFAKLCEILDDPEFRKEFPNMGFDTQVHTFFRRAYRLLKENDADIYKHSIYKCLSCSNMKTSLAIGPGHKVYFCHDSFFFDEKVRDIIKQKGKTTEFEKMSGFPFASYENHMKHWDQFDIDNDLKTSRVLSISRSMLENFSLRLQYIELMVKQYALSKQIDVDPTDNTLISVIAGLMIFSGIECPVNNIWENGSIALRNPSFLRLYFNGAEKYLLKGMKL